MSTQLSKRSAVTLAFGGTLGDAFIVLCKLYSQHKKTGEKYRLYRYSVHPGMDKPIQELFSTVPFIEYIVPCITCKTPEEVHSSIEKSAYGILDTRWSGDGLETFSIDYDNLDPFPLIETREVEVGNGLPNIGIQLHCGSEGTNFRGFSLKWLKETRKHFPKEGFSIYLFGTGASCYKKEDIETICQEQKINNMIGKTDFSTFMGMIEKMDCFISLEGFSALFAMSQKVKTLLYNQYPYGIESTIHPRWYENNLVIQINTNKLARKSRSLLNKIKLYSPVIPDSFFRS